MLMRLLMVANIFISTTVYSYSADGYRIKRDSNDTDLALTVGKEILIPEIEEETEEEQEKEVQKLPVTDVLPKKGDLMLKDKQKHDRKGKNIESGMPPRYPLKTESAETSAHDNEIGGCRDHPRAGLVCSKCENGNKCFPAEHESYTYSYCRRSCRHCDPSTSSFHTFWRLRAESEFEPTWMLQQVEFYADPQEKISLVDNPDKAYASSVYTGYKPSFAFDNNNSTAWYPSGWGIHDNNDDWIAYEFTVAVRVHGIRMVVDKDHATAAPKKVVVEASDKMYGPFTKKWTIYNTDYSVDKIYKLLECDVLWRRFEVDDGAWCFRLIAKLETWEGARRACEIEGGDIATIANKDEQRFVTDDVGVCSHTWFGLSHTNQGYFWNDGSNATFRNWKDELTYSDVQKQTLNCAAMDPEGIWYNFHCSNKFYFLCKKRLVPRANARPELTDNAWPYPPEVPPLIFFSPNVTVPVINSKNLEPGIFPDANGKVEGEEEEDITLSDLFYEQTVEHLKEKGLKPSEEIQADKDQEESDFTQELNKIAINTSPGDFQNETKADTTKNGSAQAHYQEQDLEHIPNKEANNAASVDAKKPKPQHKELHPVPPPPEESNGEEDSSYPEIVHGKPVQDVSKNSSRNRPRKVPKGAPLHKDSTHTQYAPDEQANVHEQPHKAGTINANPKKKGKKTPVQSNSVQQSVQASLLPNSSYQPSMMFYVPNANGTYTLMRPIYPWGSVGNGYPLDTSGRMQYTGGNIASSAQPPQPEEGDKDDGKKGEIQGKSAQQLAQASSLLNSSYDPSKMFYAPNANGTYTLMRPIYPWGSVGNGYSLDTPGNMQYTGGNMAYSAESPQPEEGDNDDDNNGEKNKEIPMQPMVGPLDANLVQQNISKSSRRKIKVLLPLESAAQEDYSVMSEVNKMKRKKVLSRTSIHPKHETIALASKHFHAKGKDATKSKVTPKISAIVQPKVYDRYYTKATLSISPKVPVGVPKKVNSKSVSMNVKKVKASPKHFLNSTSFPSLGIDKESGEGEESGSGSGIDFESDSADIIDNADADEWVWSK